MNKTKKIISIVLAMVLVVSVGMVMLVSNAGDNTPTTSITVTADKTELKAGESATVTVKATTNYAVGTMSIPVFYDKTLVDVSEGAATLTEYDVKNVTTDLTAVDTSKIYANTDINSEKYGFVLASYIASANSTVQTMLEDVVVLTFKITAKADVSGTAAIMVVTESAKTEKNIQGMLYFGKQPDGNTIDAIPENIEGINVDNASTSVTIGNGTPELILTDLGAEIGAVISTAYGVADGFDGAVFGVDTLALGYNQSATLEEAFTTEAGYIVVNTDNSNGTETTGAVIELYDDNDELVASYVFVYFGDVNMDGTVDTVDATYIEEYYGWITDITEEYVLMSADINGDITVDTVDATVIEEYYGWISDMPEQADVAQAYV